MSAVAGLPRTVLRLHRTALIVWGAFIGAAIVWLVWLNEVTVDSVHAVLAGCDDTKGFCSNVAAELDYSEPTGWIGACVCYSFLAVAAWAGSSLIGRELENGTAHLAWTQGVSPTRWLAAKLTMPALALVLGGTALVLAFRWGWGAHRDLMGDDWTFDDVFVARGPLTVAYALCALAVGTLTALALRRTLPALGVSFAAMWILNLVLQFNRTSLRPAVTRVSASPFELSNSVWQVENGTLTDGHRTEGFAHSTCDGTASEVKRCIDDLGIDGYYAVYHPQSHFWPLHLMETGIVLAVAATATAAAFWLLHRRTA